MQQHDANEILELRFAQPQAMEAVCGALFVGGEDSLLVRLLLSNKPMSAGSLARDLGVTSGRVANIMRSLEAKGLIIRESDANDLRRVSARLTEKGRAVAVERRQAFEGQCCSLFSSLGEQDTDEFVRLVRKACDGMRLD